MSVTCRITLRPAPVLAGAILAAHGAAALAAGWLMQDARGAALAAALLALGTLSAWRRALLRGRDSVRGLELGEGRIRARLGNGEEVEVPVAPRRYVSRLFVTLRLGAPLSRTLLVSADMLDHAGFRRLRVWALWGRLPNVAAGQLAG